MTPEGWNSLPVRDLLRSISTGVSVNSESRARGAGEVGVLKTSAVTYGVFRPEENKVVVPEEIHRIRENPKAGCVLLSRMNTPALVGASAYVDRDWPDLVLPDRIWQLLPDHARTDGRWLFHLLAAPATRSALSELASGTSGSMKNLAQEKFMAMRLLVPPLPEQKKIAVILSSVDEDIEATQAVIDQLQVVKKAMMAELLTKGLPNRHARFKQTEIGEVPEAWQVVHLETVLADGPSNGIYKPAHLIGRGALIAGMTAIDGSTLLWKACRRAELEGSEAERFGLQERDILVTRVYARVEGIGRFIVVPKPPETSVYESNMMRIRIDPGAAMPEFVALHMGLDDIRKEIEQRATLGAQASINNAGVRTLPLRLPSMGEQQEIVQTIGAVTSRSDSEIAVLQQLKHAKTALMSVLLTGEVRVKPDEGVA